MRWSIESGSAMVITPPRPDSRASAPQPRASRSLHQNATRYVSRSPTLTISVSSHRLTAKRCVCVVRHATVLNAFRDSQLTELLILECQLARSHHLNSKHKSIASPTPLNEMGGRRRMLTGLYLVESRRLDDAGNETFCQIT